MNEILKDNSAVQVNYRNIADGVELLRQIKDRSIKAVFFDPQYRGVLDKMSYGNEGKNRGRDRSALPQMTEKIISEFLAEIERILVPSGYLFLWVDKFHLVEGIKDWFKDLGSIQAVDMITWNKMKIGMGYRTRRKCEYLVILQKHPKLAKATWKLHNIPDVWDEKVDKIHTNCRSSLFLRLLRKTILYATPQQEDIPCSEPVSRQSVIS